jgi:3-oxoacyl-[acyl-carrier-protein] synthase II
MTDDVVITGSAVISGLGNSKSAVWPALLSGKSSVGPLRGFPSNEFEGISGSRVRGLDSARLGLPPRMTRLMDLPSLMLMTCASDALAEAKLHRGVLPGEAMAFFAGMGMVDYEFSQLLPAVEKSQTVDGKLDYSRFFAEGYREIYPLWPLSMLNNVGFCQIAIGLGILGENAVFAGQADAGFQALVEALWSLRKKRARAAVVGGVSGRISPFSLARAELAGTLEPSGNQENTGCGPFSRWRSGTVPGEGCGVLVLESRSAAMDRGGSFIARIPGYGFACQAEGDSSNPTETAIAAAAEQAISRAGLSPSAIDLVIGHGHGTLEEDLNEIRAVNGIFFGREPSIPFFSSKGALGNCQAGSLTVDVVLAVCILQHKVIPPMLNGDSPEASKEFNRVGNDSQTGSPRCILINGRSPGGPCVSLVVEACD